MDTAQILMKESRPMINFIFNSIHEFHLFKKQKFCQSFLDIIPFTISHIKERGDDDIVK